MAAPRKRKGHYQWKHNLKLKNSKTLRIPFKLLRQIGGKRKRSIKVIRNGRSKKSKR
jgi:hypothetical protein